MEDIKKSFNGNIMRCRDGRNSVLICYIEFVGGIKYNVDEIYRK